jgi:aspartyl-tRNA synthetase
MFYALPQAPQQFKQLLMVAGFDRYFQIAPCFRDEDGRADRSPGEFYQLDFEMSFVTQEDVWRAIEPVLHGVFEEFADGRAVSPAPFPRIPFDEAMAKYGTDKPDLRNPLEIADVGEVFACSGFALFANAASRGAVVRAVAGERRGGRDASIARGGRGKQGLGWRHLLGEGVARARCAVPSTPPPGRLSQVTGSKSGDCIFLRSDRRDVADPLAGSSGTRLGEELAPTRRTPSLLLDHRLSYVRVGRGRQEDRLQPQSVLDAAG